MGPYRRPGTDRGAPGDEDEWNYHPQNRPYFPPPPPFQDGSPGPSSHAQSSNHSTLPPSGPPDGAPSASPDRLPSIDEALRQQDAWFENLPPARVSPASPPSGNLQGDRGPLPLPRPLPIPNLSSSSSHQSPHGSLPHFRTSFPNGDPFLPSTSEIQARTSGRPSRRLPEVPRAVMVRVLDWEMPLAQLPAPPSQHSYYIPEWFLRVNVRARLTAERFVVTLKLPDQLWGREYDFRPFPEDHWQGLEGYGSVHKEMELQIWGSAGPDALPADEAWLRRAMALVVGRDGIRGLEELAEKTWMWVE
ncbi:hypothetical protein B0T18DRAFT_487853 [Schizothecium vesticola]|uniref:Uncharacterized protein n=1 Tax=Schizothecium vesticola TaxID=314040 RepID=A0AA40F2P6_9PEZI|nr:hypothetical protein B0T18DRAFT_487853 [Schizothecium vesticola]